MTDVVKIKESELVLARHIPATVVWQDGLNFFSQDDNFIQVGVWGYNERKELRHIFMTKSNVKCFGHKKCCSCVVVN